MASREEGRRRPSQESANHRRTHHDRHQNRPVDDRKQSGHHRQSPRPQAMQQNQQQPEAPLLLPPPPNYPPPAMSTAARHRNDRNRGRNSHSSSPSNRSGSSNSRRHHRHRGAKRRRLDDNDERGSQSHGSGDEGRRRRRPRRRRRRRSPSSSPPKAGQSESPRRRGSRSPPPRRRRRSPSRNNDENANRRGGRRAPTNRSDDSLISSSPDTGNRRGRRRKRRRRPSRRRHGDRRGSRSPASEARRGAPVANDVAPRAGVVSDDDFHGLPAAARPTRQNEVTAGRAPGAAKKRSSHSSSHDDTIGHFKGREGTVIANRYRIEREVGVGTFGRVVECLDLKRFSRSGRRDRQDSVVAIKIVRNVKRYYESALIEADIVEDVNRRGGRGVSHCAVMYDAFTFSGHYCMVFEKLGPSLYDFQKRQKYRPFPLMCVRDFAKQLLETLEFLHSFGLIHTDLKPENILLVNGREVTYKGHTIPESTRIKVIDFGGATYDNEKKSSVVNTRQYRAPEVILGVGWSMPSDLWSIGCILAELYQGELLFATHDNIEHLALIEQVVGPFPRRMLKRAKNTQLVDEAFDSMGAHRMERKLPPESLAYVKRIGSLESLTNGADPWFLRLLRRILVTDPVERATARECLRKL